MRYIYLVFIFFLSINSLGAQDVMSTDEVVSSSIFDKIPVKQSAAIRKLVGVRLHGENVVITEDETYLKISGFRTQVFTGNNQRTSKKEAFEKEKEIKDKYPDLPTYVTYTAPFWKLRVGDFRSHEEAYAIMRQLMDDFPKFGKEMYIVREEIHLPFD